MSSVDQIYLAGVILAFLAFACGLSRCRSTSNSTTAGRSRLHRRTRRASTADPNSPPDPAANVVSVRGDRAYDGRARQRLRAAQSRPAWEITMSKTNRPTPVRTSLNDPRSTGGPPRPPVRDIGGLKGTKTR